MPLAIQVYAGTELGAEVRVDIPVASLFLFSLWQWGHEAHQPCGIST